MAASALINRWEELRKNPDMFEVEVEFESGVTRPCFIEKPLSDDYWAEILDTQNECDLSDIICAVTVLGERIPVDADGDWCLRTEELLA